MRERVVARGPGRVNLIGEHTDYNDGLCLPFAIARGVTVTAEALPEPMIEAHALDLHEQDRFALDDRSRADGWRAFVRGVVAELAAAGEPLAGARLRFGGDVPRGSGLSSSAALEVALCLGLLGLIGREDTDRLELARLCSRVENDWVGAQTGLLDQLAALFGEEGRAVLIDCRTLELTPVTLSLGGWRLATFDSGAEHTHAGSGYNERRAECQAACEALGIDSLREATRADVDRLPEPLSRRVQHVVEENARVLDTVRALERDDLEAVAHLLDASHRSLRDLYESSHPQVDATVERLTAAGAAGARIMGGGFGGHVLALFRPDAELPEGGIEVVPGPGAHLVER